MGRLYLDSGIWMGLRIASEAGVRESAAGHGFLNESDDYEFACGGRLRRSVAGPSARITPAATVAGFSLWFPISV